MTLAFLKYGLPVLLGYTLFVGVSGRLNPWAFPIHREERASWLLGIWTGLGLCLALSAGLILAHASSPIDAISALKTSATLFAVILVPTFGLYAYYRMNNGNVRLFGTPTNFNRALNEEVLQQSSIENGNAKTQHNELCEQQLPTKDTYPEHVNNLPPQASAPKVNPACLETAQVNQMLSASTAVAVNNSPDNQHLLPELREKLAAEVALREETEQHLRITRKALSVLEANTREQSNIEADSIIDLEEQLAQSIKIAADNESDAMEQRARRVEVEQDIADLKARMVKAKQEIRQSAAARAKALSTANQSIAFARQSVQIRTRLESELSEAQTTINNREKTISSLIRALEKEKRKTQSEVGSMARHIVLQEKQLKARRALEEVARGVENKLTSRLVKKVAKAKPLMSDMNQGQAN